MFKKSQQMTNDKTFQQVCLFVSKAVEHLQLMSRVRIWVLPFLFSRFKINRKGGSFADKNHQTNLRT